MVIEFRPDWSSDNNCAMNHTVTSVSALSQLSQERPSDDLVQQMLSLREENEALRRKNTEVGHVYIYIYMYSGGYTVDVHVNKGKGKWRHSRQTADFDEKSLSGIRIHDV